MTAQNLTLAHTLVSTVLLNAWFWSNIRGLLTKTRLPQIVWLRVQPRRKTLHSLATAHIHLSCSGIVILPCAQRLTTERMVIYTGRSFGQKYDHILWSNLQPVHIVQFLSNHVANEEMILWLSIKEPNETGINRAIHFIFFLLFSLVYGVVSYFYKLEMLPFSSIP